MTDWKAEYLRLLEECREANERASRWETLFRNGHDMNADGTPKCVPNPDTKAPDAKAAGLLYGKPATANELASAALDHAIRGRR